MDELFKNIDEITKNKILQSIETYKRNYKKNQTILTSVKNDDVICLLLSGHIQIIKNDIKGNITVIEDTEDSGIFGAISANISSPEIEIITKEDSEMIIMDLDNIIKYSIIKVILQNKSYFILNNIFKLE